jgi:signal transduction histidine kinase
MADLNHHAAATVDRVVPVSEPRPRFWFLSRSALLLLIVCGVAAGVGIFAMLDLRTAAIQVQEMYAGSVLGLRRISELTYQAQETRRSTLYALTTSNSNLQVEYADLSREADRRVTEGIADYLKQARTPHEVQVGQRLQDDWSAYLKVRDEVLGLILEGNTKDAVAFDLEFGVPSFERVRNDLDDTKKLYDERASRQVAIADVSSRRSVVRLIAVVCLTLLFASFAIWAVHRSRMQAALQLAKLQMDFVAGVSHELRTPLSVICSAADNIADGVVEGKSELARYGSILRNQARQITELVDQVLLFASIKDRKTRGYVLRPLPVAQLIATVLENTSELLQEAEIVLDRDIEPQLPEIMGDMSALAQCLQNLVVNAVKYSGDQRWIGIRAFVHENGKGVREIQINVQDHGIGIAGSEVQRIFDPFYRSPSVSAAQIHGTGLGLTLARNIAEAMGGRLSVSSELGHGSIFSLHLPVAQESQYAAAAATF